MAWPTFLSNLGTAIKSGFKRCFDRKKEEPEDDTPATESCCKKTNKYPLAVAKILTSVGNAVFFAITIANFICIKWFKKEEAPVAFEDILIFTYFSTTLALISTLRAAKMVRAPSSRKLVVDEEEFPIHETTFRNGLYYVNKVFACIYGLYGFTFSKLALLHLLILSQKLLKLMQLNFTYDESCENNPIKNNQDLIFFLTTEAVSLYLGLSITYSFIVTNYPQIEKANKKFIKNGEYVNLSCETVGLTIAAVLPQIPGFIYGNMKQVDIFNKTVFCRTNFEIDHTGSLIFATTGTISAIVVGVLTSLLANHRAKDKKIKQNFMDNLKIISYKCYPFILFPMVLDVLGTALMTNATVENLPKTIAHIEPEDINFAFFRYSAIWVLRIIGVALGIVGCPNTWRTHNMILTEEVAYYAGEKQPQSAPALPAPSLTVPLLDEETTPSDNRIINIMTPSKLLPYRAPESPGRIVSSPDRSNSTRSSPLRSNSPTKTRIDVFSNSPGSKSVRSPALGSRSPVRNPGAGLGSPGRWSAIQGVKPGWVASPTRTHGKVSKVSVANPGSPR